jgi:hypothetical protein
MQRHSSDVSPAEIKFSNLVGEFDWSGLPRGEAAGSSPRGPAGALLLLKLVFAYAAQGADEILRDILPLGAGSQALLLVSLCLVVDIAADGAHIGFHFSFPLSFFRIQTHPAPAGQFPYIIIHQAKKSDGKNRKNSCF